MVRACRFVPRTGVGQGILPLSLDLDMVVLIAVLRCRGVARCVGVSTLMKQLSISFFSRMRARLSLYDIVTTFSAKSWSKPAKREPQMQAGQGATQQWPNGSMRLACLEMRHVDRRISGTCASGTCASKARMDNPVRRADRSASMHKRMNDDSKMTSPGQKMKL